MNILHLSDIHFGRNYKRYGLDDKFDDKEKILDDLIECITKLGNFKPEHIVVTGDIAWYGLKDEYDEALLWFKKLLQAIELKGKDITFCVGNHDVNRSHANFNKNINDSSLKEIDDIYDYDNIHKMESPIYEYERFCENLCVEPFIYPSNHRIAYSYSVGYKDVKFPSLNTIRLVTFNTALLSFMPKKIISEDKMWIGQKQVKSLLDYGIIPNKDVHYTMALFHHAERFLHPNEICEYDGRVATLSLLRKNVDLILCGHTETGGIPVLQRQLGGGITLNAGATYFSDTHRNAFSIVSIPDNTKDPIINPYTYNNGWKQYNIEPQIVARRKLYDLPPLGDLQERCKMVLKSGNSKYEIPIKKLSVYYYGIDGFQYIGITGDTSERTQCFSAVVNCKNSKITVSFWDVGLSGEDQNHYDWVLENDKSSVVHYNGWSRETICDSIQCNALAESNTVEINTYGDSFKIVLNNVILHEKLLALIPHISAVCTVDEKTLEIITKLVNFSEKEITVNIRTDNDMMNEAKITTLTGDSYYSKNTFENKTAVFHYTERTKASSDYNVVIKPRSVNVIKQTIANTNLSGS